LPMLYFNVTRCNNGDVNTYDNGRCVKKSQYQIKEICNILVLEDCELEVNKFSLDDNVYLYLGETSYTKASGPEDGLNLKEGDVFIFVTVSSDISSSSGGFDMCCKNPQNFELRNGTKAGEGNIYLNGQPICNDHWDADDASVVCRVLGYDYGEATNSTAFDVVPNNFIMNEVGCTGDESSIWDCKYTTDTNCTSDIGASLRCFVEPAKKDDYTTVVVIPTLIIAFVLLILYIFRWRNNRLKSHQHNQYDQLGIALQKKEEEKIAASKNATPEKPEVSKDLPKNPSRVTYQPLLDSNLPKFRSSSEEDSVEEVPKDVEIIRLASTDPTAGNEVSAPPAPADINPAYVPPSYQP
jgi:hypothetical protein